MSTTTHSILTTFIVLIAITQTPFVVQLCLDPYTFLRNNKQTMVGLSSLLPGSKSESKDFDVEAVLSSLSLAEKISLLGGKVNIHTP
jgi:hypothetical protein